MHKQFSELLAKAVAGDHGAIEEILEMYAPLIDRHSRIGGRLDEDCRQYILMRVVVGIGKFML